MTKDEIDKLLEGVEMPEAHQLFTERCGHFVVSTDQMRETVAAAVLRKDAEIRRMGEDLTAIQTMHNDQKAKLYHDKSELQARAASLSTKLLIADTREKELKAENERLRESCRMQPLYDFSQDLEKADAKTERLVECALRLVEHADFKLGGILSADSKSKDIPSKATSYVKSRHLAALRDALAAMKGQP